MSFLDPNIIDLEKKLLGEYYGKTNVISNDTGIELPDQLQNLQSSITNKNNLSVGSSKPLGAEDLHLQHPNEIEYYACAFELINSKGDTEKFFSFPVMPNSITINKTSNTNISKTIAGVVVSSNPTFVPFDINLSGNFGRRFRRILKTPKTEAPKKKLSKTSTGTRVSKEFGTGQIDYVLNGVTVSGKANMFSTDYKTGYGNMKILEALIEKSQSSDENYRPYKLIFYNLSFNQRYMVEVTGITFTQTKELNRIWQYSMNLKVVAPADSIKPYENSKQSLKYILDFKNKNREFSEQTNMINGLLKEKGSFETTAIRQMLERQLKGRLQNAIDKNRYGVNGISAIQLLVQNPNNIDDFIANSGEGLLNRF